MRVYLCIYCILTYAESRDICVRSSCRARISPTEQTKLRKREKGKRRSKRITKSNTEQKEEEEAQKKVESSGNEWRGKNDGGNLIFHKLKINQK